jgi:hypothetical protein
MPSSDFSRIDHLIFGVPDLQAGIELIRHQLGLSPSSGGQHPHFGTHNALFKMGERTYFEIIAPDPALAHLQRKLWMGLDQLETPALIWWAAQTDDLEAAIHAANRSGWDPGQPIAGSRTTADGTVLHWRLTDPYRVQEGGVLPFLIDWEKSPHPTDNMPDSPCSLTDFQLLHPNPEKIRVYLDAIELPVPVVYHPIPKIRAGFTVMGKSVYL